MLVLRGFLKTKLRRDLYMQMTQYSVYSTMRRGVTL